MVRCGAQRTLEMGITKALLLLGITVWKMEGLLEIAKQGSEQRCAMIVSRRRQRDMEAACG